jgi:enoyl-CoA hydratase/carnithine racemase
MTDAVLVERRDTLIDITLNTPENGNLVSNEMAAALVAALGDLGPEVKLVRLLAKGADFCRGRVSPMPAKGTPVNAHDLKHKVADPALRAYAALRAAPAPILGVVSGQALGFGCALAAACDLTIACEDAVFRVPEMERDIPPALVMFALRQRIPPKAVAQLVLSTEPIGAAQALHWGLVTKIVAAADLEREREALTRRLLGYSAVSARAVKEYLWSAWSMDGQGAMALAGHLSGTALSTRFRG